MRGRQALLTAPATCAINIETRCIIASDHRFDQSQGRWCLKFFKHRQVTADQPQTKAIRRRRPPHAHIYYSPHHLGSWGSPSWLASRLGGQGKCQTNEECWSSSTWCEETRPPILPDFESAIAGRAAHAGGPGAAGCLVAAGPPTALAAATACRAPCPSWRSCAAASSGRPAAGELFEGWGRAEPSACAPLAWPSRSPGPHPSVLLAGLTAGCWLPCCLGPH